MVQGATETSPERTQMALEAKEITNDPDALFKGPFSSKDLDHYIESGDFDILYNDDFLRVVDTQPSANENRVQVEFFRPKSSDKTLTYKYAVAYFDMVWELVMSDDHPMREFSDDVTSWIGMEVAEAVNEYFGIVFPDTVYEALFCAGLASDLEDCVKMIRTGMIFRVLLGEKVDYKGFA
jgi:hypothetical protein